jgi:hypothetical protein
MPILKIGEKFGLITVIGEPEKRRNGTDLLPVDCYHYWVMANVCLWVWLMFNYIYM